MNQRNSRQLFKKGACEKEKRLKAQWSDTCPQVQNDTLKWKLEVMQMENSILKMKRKDRNPTHLVDKVKKEQAEWALTHGDKI